jgi:hypothetical protein
MNGLAKKGRVKVVLFSLEKQLHLRKEEEKSGN